VALKRLVLWLALCLLPVPVHAQQTSTYPTTATSSGGAAGATITTASGAIAADDQTVALSGLTTYATVFVTITDGSWDGVLQFDTRESSSATWLPTHCVNSFSTATPGQYLTAVSGLAGNYQLNCPIAGVNEFRVRGVGWGSGTATIGLRATTAPSIVYAQITNPTSIPVQASILSGTGSRVRTGDWFGSAFTAASSSDVTNTSSAQIVRAIPADASASGLITAADETVSTELGGAAALSVLWTDGWTGNVALEKSLDNVTWETIDTVTGGAAPTTVQSYSVQGFRYFRARGTTISAGTATLQLRVSPTALPAVGGGGGGGGDGAILDGAVPTRKATVTASNALKVDGSAVTQPVSGTFWQATQPVSAARSGKPHSRSAALSGKPPSRSLEPSASATSPRRRP
jgi:hypothetical protein